MVTRRTWLTLWFTTLCWLTVSGGSASICELSPCKCSKGKLECDCSTSELKKITLKPEQFDSLSLSSVRVENCLSLHVTSRALSGLPALQLVSVANISIVTLEEQSFSYSGNNPQLMVNISHCHLPEIPSYCFRGQLRDIVFTDVRISRVRAYAFCSMDNAEKLAFNRVHVDLLEPQSFKKFTVQLLSFINTNVTLVSRRALSDVEVLEEVRLERFHSDRLEVNALNIHSSRSFKVIQSTFKHLEEKAINANTKGDVSIHENAFSHIEKGAFLGITVDARYTQEAGKEDFIFENNTLETFDNGALTFNTSGFNLRLDWIKINQKCSCDKADIWASDLLYFSPDPSVRSLVPQTSSVTFCLNPKYTRIRDFLNSNCSVAQSSLFLKILFALLIILGIAAIVYLARHYRSKKKGKRYIHVPTATNVLKPASANRGHMLVVPDGKTYRETELQVIIEHAEPIVPIDFVKERPDGNRTE